MTGKKTKKVGAIDEGSTTWKKEFGNRSIVILGGPRPASAKPSPEPEEKQEKTEESADEGNSVADEKKSRE